MTQPLDRKIIALPALLERVGDVRAAGRTVVHCHGCFDLVHPGHIRYLRFARELGDVLVVSLTGDDGIDKGVDRPYIPQELRAESLAALEFVDWVVVDPHPTAADLLAALRPDVYVKGREYAHMNDPRFLREREIVEGYGGRVVFHSGDIVFSSTRLMRSRERDEPLDECRLRTLCGRSGIDAASAREAVARWEGVRAVVVGDLIREHYVSCDASETADDAPVLSLQRLGATSYWGGAAAVALQLRALGAIPTLVTAGVEGDSRPEIEPALSGRDVGLRMLPMRREAVERTTFVADDAKLMRMNEGACHPLDSAWERRAKALLDGLLDQADLLIWCDYGYGMVTPGLVAAIAPVVRRAEVTIAGCAPGARGEIGELHDTDVLCLTERRLREALHDMSASLPSVTWNLLNRTNARRAIVALHKRGLIGFDGHADADAVAHEPGAREGAPGRLRSEFVPTLALHYVDMLGVQEAVLAAVALTTATRGALAMTTYLAAGVEALAAGRPGRTPVTMHDLHAWMDTRPELRAQSHFLPDAATLSDIARLAPPLCADTTEAGACAACPTATACAGGDV